MTVIYIVGQMRGKHPDCLLPVRLSMHKILCSLCGTWLWKRLRALTETLLLADNNLNFNLRPRSLAPHLLAQIVIYIVAPRDSFRLANVKHSFSFSCFFFFSSSFILHLLFSHTYVLPAWQTSDPIQSDLIISSLRGNFALTHFLSRNSQAIIRNRKRDLNKICRFAVLYLISFNCLKLSSIYFFLFFLSF